MMVRVLVHGAMVHVRQIQIGMDMEMIVTHVHTVWHVSSFDIHQRHYVLWTYLRFVRGRQYIIFQSLD